MILNSAEQLIDMSEGTTAEDEDKYTYYECEFLYILVNYI